MRDYNDMVTEAYRRRFATTRCETISHGACGEYREYCNCQCHIDDIRTALDTASVCTLCFGVGVNAFAPGPCVKCSPEPRPAPQWCNPMDTLYDLAGEDES